MSKASRLKGHCNRLFAISELPAHQAKTWWRFFLGFGKGGFSVLMLGCFLLAVCPLSFVRMPPAFAAVSLPANAALDTASTFFASP
jgi:hypothetical protein